MKSGKFLLLAALLVVALLPAQVAAQGGDPPPPPPGCCPEPPPPPPEGEGMVATGGSGTAVGPYFYMADAALAQVGLTRSQFLSRVAGALFLDPSATIGIVIPIATQVTLADGTVTIQIGYYQFELSKVAPEIIDALDLMYLNDGKTYIGIHFIRDTGTAER